MKYFMKVTNWKLVALFLLNDKTGSKVEIIERSNQSDFYNCCLAMLRQYFESGDVSWNNVLKALQDAQYKNLADEIMKEQCKYRKYRKKSCETTCELWLYIIMWESSNVKVCGALL